MWIAPSSQGVPSVTCSVVGRSHQAFGTGRRRISTADLGCMLRDSRSVKDLIPRVSPVYLLASLTCCPSAMLGDIDQRVGLTQAPTPMELRFHFRFSGSGKVWQKCRLPSKFQAPLFHWPSWFSGTSLVACAAVFPRRVAFRVAVSQATRLCIENNW